MFYFVCTIKQPSIKYYVAESEGCALYVVLLAISPTVENTITFSNNSCVFYTNNI